MDFSDDEEEEGPKSNHPLDAEEIKERMWDSIKWTYLLPFCERFKLISKEQEATLVKIGRSPEIVSAEIVKAVKQQGEEGYQRFRQALSVGSKENAKKLEPIAHIYNRLPETLPPEKQAEPQDAATVQRNWLIRHFKSMGKIDHTSIHFSSMLVDVSKCMDLDMEAAGIFCLQSMKMFDGSPLFTGMYMREADTPDNLFISMERNKLVHSRDGDVMEALCLEMDRPDLLRYISEFHSKVEIIPAEPEGVKLYLNDRFIVRTLVHNKRNLTFDDVLRVKAIISEHYKIGRHIFQFRGWMKGANSSAIIFWQFPYVYIDYLMKVILEKVDDLVHRDIYRIELHMSPDSYEDVTVYDLQHIYFHRLKEDFRRHHAEYLAKKKAEDDKKDDGGASAGGKDGGASAGDKDGAGSQDDTSQPQTRSKTANKKTAEKSKSSSGKSSPTSSKRSFDGTPRDDPSRMGEQSYRNALKHRRIYPDTYYNLGNLYLDMKNYDAAAASFRAAIGQKLDHSNAWNNLALMYDNIGQLQTAEEVWREAIDVLPSTSTFYYSLGSLLGRTDRYQDAEKYLKKAIDIDPHISSYRGNLGVLYHRMGQYQLAERSYSNALRQSIIITIMAAGELSSNDVTAWLDAHPHFCMRYYSKKYGNTPLLGADPFADPRKDISRRKSVPSRKSSHELRRMDRNELIMELVRDIADELDVNSLSHKILINVNILLNADRSSLFLREGQGDNCYLVSRLFDVREGSSVAESVHDESDAIRIKCGVGIVGYAAETRETVNIADAYEDERFNKQVDKMTGYVTKSILCTPLSNSDGQVIGVAQVINKSGGSEIFTPSDVKIFRTYMTFCAIGLTNAKLYEQSLMESKRSRLLLSLAKKLFEDQTSLDRMVTQIMLQATELVKCERCTVLLLDTNKEHITFSNVFTGGGDIKCGRSSEQVTPACDEVVKGVAQTGKPCQLQDDQQLLEGNIKSLLCMPIYNGDDIIGVAQLINKLNGLPFDENDERYFEMFAIFCGLGIHNVINYEQKCKALARYSVALEQMSYHTTASSEDSAYLATAVVPVAKEMDLYSFQFNDTSLSDDKTLLACISMFSELNLIQSFNIDYKVLCNWLYTVRRNYRAVKYHNWRHAFSVSQTMFAMITSGNLGNVLSPLETLSLIVACLCHDIDHRGTNNAFQAKSCSPLATLYSTSIMERHHFAHSIMILNSKGNNIFSGLEEQDYKLVVNMLEKAILATDLAVYFQKKDQFTQLGKRDTSEWSKDCHHELLRAMMMTACDLAAITKPWEIQQKVAECVADEFFEQGDKERNELHLEPMAMMDRKKKSDLPKMQVDFIDSICLPVYSTFANMTESLQPLLQGIQDNRRNWVEQKQLCVNGH